jgi:hypothetical protein
VRLYAFDLLADDGVDMRDKTLQIRKLWLGKLLTASIASAVVRQLRAWSRTGSGKSPKMNDVLGDLPDPVICNQGIIVLFHQQSWH